MIMEGETYRKQYYGKCRTVVKKWELNFRKQHKRDPTKDDIMSASQDVKEAYKSYWYLKATALKNCFLQSENLEPTKHEHGMKQQQELRPDYDSKIDRCTVSHTENSHNNINVLSKTNSSTVFGSYLDGKHKFDKKNRTLVRSFSSKYSEKLFQGSCFNKRNPRRASSFNSNSFRSVSSVSSSFIDESSQSSISSVNNLTDSELSEVTFPEGNALVSIKSVSSVSSLIDESSQSSISSVNNLTDSVLSEVTFSEGNALANIANRTQVGGDQLSNAIHLGAFAKPTDAAGCSDSFWLVPDGQKLFEEPFDENSQDSVSSFVSSADDVDIPSSPEMVTEINDSENFIDEIKVPISRPPNFPFVNTPTKVLAHERANKHIDKGWLERCEQKCSLDFDIPCAEKKVGVISPKNSHRDKHRQKMLEKKLASGKANENFVRVNLKKKIYARGKKTMTSWKYKKQQWKLKKKLLEGNECGSEFRVIRCFKCGDVGHYSRNCIRVLEIAETTEADDEGIEPSPFPSLQEVAEMALQSNDFAACGSEIADNIDTEDKCHIEPLHSTEEDVEEVLHLFGHRTFRKGQKEAILDILAGKSALVALSTGSGKSLCYQIPAYLYKKRRGNCITLVVSPLVSLMEDQMLGIPSVLNAVCLHTNQTSKQREAALDRIKNCEASVLFVSPETVVAEDRNCVLMDILPPISFVCIDEAHCISQWSHNFRPSYLMLCRVLRERFQVRFFLGLTASATEATIQSIAANISDRENSCEIIQDRHVPDNLVLSVSKGENKDAALLALLKSSPFADSNSIIVYCIQRSECERLASYIRTLLRDPKLESIIVAEAYHAGLSASKRKQVQRAFMSGKLRIVVATVAFGMGVNKSDIRAVIHFNMPRTFEHYVQEIGRAGRDGQPAYCHMFMDAQKNDISELSRHIYADSVDRHTLRRLLQKVFVSCKCDEICKKHEVAFSVEQSVKALDLREENILTLLYYLELHPKNWIQVLTPSHMLCTVNTYTGITVLKRLARNCPSLAAAIALEEKKLGTSFTSKKFSFSIIDVANVLQCDSAVIKRQLKSCEWIRENETRKKSGVIVEFHDVGFRVRSPGNLSAAELDEVLVALHEKTRSQEEIAISQLRQAYQAFDTVAYNNIMECMESLEISRSDALKLQIKLYFEDTPLSADYKEERRLRNEEVVINDVRRLVSAYKDVSFTGRIVAKIFYGIESPSFPLTVWSRSPFWRLHLKEDFNLLCSVATTELIKLR